MRRKGGGKGRKGGGREGEGEGRKGERGNLACIFIELGTIYKNVS